MINRILFCVETTKRADTDYQYIRETIRQFYEETSKNVIRPVYMESKTRYNSKAVQEEIRRQSEYSEKTKVIYCIDTDDYDVSADDGKLLERIREYCDANGYDFVFFCKDVEDVFCGRKIPDTEKISAIRKYKSSQAIRNMKADHLEKDEYQIHCSNILNVLDQYWKRRK